MIDEGSIQNTNDRVDAKIVGRIVSDPLIFWTRIIKREVQPNEVPDNYLGSHALEYRDEDMLEIVSAFFPIMHLTPHTGGLIGNLAAFKNTDGCDEQEDLYLLQNKRDFLNTFEAGSEKQSMVEFSAVLQYVNALTKYMAKKSNRMVYYNVGDFSPFSGETSSKAHLLFSETLNNYNMRVIDDLLDLLENRVAELEGSGVRGDDSVVKGQKGEVGAKGERGYIGSKGRKGMSGEWRMPDAESEFKNVVERILASSEFQQAIELAKENRLSEVILSGFNSTLGGVLDTVNMKLTLEFIITASIAFSVTTTFFLGFNTVCILIIFRRNRKLDAKRLSRKERGSKPAVKPRQKRR